tara:strand:- start:485 stop:907 length:423 start_codon:yes stop_codon:yes gene_type:complete
MFCCPSIRRYAGLVAIVAFAGAVLMVTSTRPVAADSSDSKHLRHVVMFQFKDASSEQDVQKVVDAFRALPKKIPVIADFEFGTNNSPEGLEDGFTHCFLVTFKSEADREVYLPHEAHQAFVEVLKPHLEKVMVIDYWAGK